MLCETTVFSVGLFGVSFCISKANITYKRTGLIAFTIQAYPDESPSENHYWVVIPESQKQMSTFNVSPVM